MADILITGGAGSLGSELALLLSGQGHHINAFDLPGLDYSAIEDKPRIEIHTGDITDPAGLRDAASGVDTVIHLAALLPPVTEDDWEKTETVNVEGTQNLVKAAGEHGNHPHIIFSSSVATYGDTASEPDPLSPDRDQAPNDNYSNSKVQAEGHIKASSLPYTILRVSGIAIPAFLEPPAVWPFMWDQRMEFVCRDDVVTALCNCVENKVAQGGAFHVAGGETWQMTGVAYVTALFELMGVPEDMAVYRDTPGWFHWYQTEDAQQVLNYQNTTFQDFLDKLNQAIQELING